MGILSVAGRAGSSSCGALARREAFVMIIVLSACLLVGCQSETLHTTIVIGATATANEPAVTLGQEDTSVIRDAVDGGTVALKVFVGSASDQPVFDKDISVYYDSAAKEVETDPDRLEKGLSSHLAPVRKILANAAGNQSDLDLLGLLGVMSRTPGPATLLVYSSGLQTTGLLDLRDQGSDLDVSATVARLPRDELPDLTGKRVIFVGLGQVAGPQQRLTEKMATSVDDLWLAVCRKAHGDCDQTILQSTGGKPVATVSVPTVPVPKLGSVVVSGGRNRHEVTITLPTGAFFKPDEAEFLPGAQQQLLSIVHYFQPDADSTPTTAAAIGHCASYGSRDGAHALSKLRAERVVAALVQGGVRRSLFNDVEGVGFDDLLVPDLDAQGHLIPDAAEENRTVILTVTSNGEFG